MRKIPPATNDNTCQMTVIEGLGGVGKTQIAPLIVITASGSSQRMSFDYIIIGAGTSGLLVANRLSANSNTRVVLIEPSSDDRNNPNVTDPLNRDKIVYHLSNYQDSLTWRLFQLLRVRTGPGPPGWSLRKSVAS
ncbi:hypothetical protein J3459_008145 [Metarhizium acridum]|nr:hypothetical protein J3459_008145 [Metarhizium acridum]